MNIVYVLGKGSPWNNNEIRYSLRSVQKFCKGFKEIYIIGEDPGFLEGIKVFPFPDKSPYNREKNIFEKIVHACMQPEIGEYFLFINDDHIFLKEVDITSYPYYHRGDLEPAFKKRPAGDSYRVSLKNTWIALSQANLTTKHFDVHTPIIYNREKFLQLTRYNWGVSYGMVIKSLYCNHHDIEGQQFEDLKLGAKTPILKIFELLKDRHVFSFGDGGLTAELKTLLQEKFPNPSLWEKSPG